MTSYESSLAIDFGEVGYWHSKHRFRVRLEAGPLGGLIQDAGNAHRVYELLLIERPGDVWDYVEVDLDDVPPRVAERVHRARQEDPSGVAGEPEARTADRIPFPAFDRLFDWMGDDTEPEDEAWLGHRETPVMRAFASQLLAEVRAAQTGLAWNDPLLEHIAAQTWRGEHPHHYLDRRVAVEKGRSPAPNAPSHTAAFYAKLSEVLRDPDLGSVAYRADGDYRVLRILATEQRSRADRTGHRPEHALHVSALVNRQASNESWGSAILYFGEGLAYGDLFIDGGGLGKGLQSLMESGRHVPGRFILSPREAGSFPGFDLETGDGWALYRKRVPDRRRAGLERIASWRRSERDYVLQFEGEGATVFDYDKTAVIVGESVAAPARSALAQGMVAWQQRGGDPLLVVLGDAAPFTLAGCVDVLRPPGTVSERDGDVAAEWFRITLGRRRPCIDVIVALEPPAWATQVLAERAQWTRSPWRPWILATGGAEQLTADVTLGDELAQILAAAHRRARDARGLPG